VRQIFTASFLIYLSLASLNLAAKSAEPNEEYGSNAVTNDSSRLSKNTYSMMDADIHNPHMLLIEAEQAFRGGELEVALLKVRQSLDLDNDDIDAHLLYARALQEKLSNQTEKDPQLFNRTVEEWLGVMRNHFGDEKRMRWHGVNPFGDLYNDEDRSIPAKTALVRLTGSSPHAFETDEHYLKRVLMPATETVTAKVVKVKGGKGSKASNELVQQYAADLNSK
jgi:hypothetical protein